MNTLNSAQAAKHAFPPIRVDLLDRLLDEAGKMNKEDEIKKPKYFSWLRK